MSLNTLQEVASVGPEVGIHGLMAHAACQFRFLLLFDPSIDGFFIDAHACPTKMIDTMLPHRLLH